MVAMRESRRESGRRQPRRGEEAGGGEMLSRVKEGASDVAQYVKDGARAARQKVRETATEATRAIKETVQEEAEQMYEKQKDKIVSRVSTAGKVVKQAARALHVMKADALAEYAKQAADRVEDATHYLEEHNLTDVLEDTGDIVRRHQALAVGGMFIAGFALSRFLKASQARHQASEEQGGRGDADDGGDAEAREQDDDDV
jgi:hypothetical protein